MNNPTFLSFRLIPQRYFSLFVACFVLFGCAEDNSPRVDSMALRAPSGGNYQQYTWHHMDAELLHPSAQPTGEDIYLVLPLPELHITQPGNAALGFVEVVAGKHALHPAVQAENKRNAFRFVVENGQAVPDRAEQMHFYVVLEFTGDHAGQIFITQKQYSLRQLGEDMAHFGVKNAVAIPLTTRGGWYRYANAPFELRKDRLDAAQLFILKQQVKP